MRNNRRGVHVHPIIRSQREQEQADQIQRTVENVEHFNYLKAKFGPRKPVEDTPEGFSVAPNRYEVA